MSSTTAIDSDCLARIRAREDAAYAARTRGSAALLEAAKGNLISGVPMPWMALLNRFTPPFIRGGDGARFTDVDGNDYLDFNVADLSMTMGYGAAPIVEAVSRQVRADAQFLLRTADAAIVARLLAERVGRPFWQYTLSASGANTEVIRIARHLTERRKIAIFDGHYHGHIDETLVASEDGASRPDHLGLLADTARQTVILPFNDLATLERTLAAEDIALVLTEPALTNCTLVLPDPGFLQGVRDLTQRYGTLLCLDEAHTFQFAYGGLTGAWSLESDFVVLGKGLGSGIPFALYGITEPVARHVERHADRETGPPGLATGGTLYGSALATTIARAALEQVLTRDAYQRVERPGRRLADGLETIFVDLDLPWRPFRIGPRSSFCLTPELQRTGAEAHLSIDIDLIDCRRVYMANHGIWDAIITAGPQVSFAHDAADIDLYLTTARAFLEELTGLDA